MRAETRSELEAIIPFDAAEAEHRTAALTWLDAGHELWRGAEPHLPDPHLVAYFPPVDLERGQVLLVDHRKAGLWLAPGGHVELGEHPRDTVTREAMEELGLEAKLLFETPLFLTVTRTVGSGPLHTDVSLWYPVAASVAAPVEFDAGEFFGVRWFPLDDLPHQRMDPHMARFAAKLGSVREGMVNGARSF